MGLAPWAILPRPFDVQSIALRAQAVALVTLFRNQPPNRFDTAKICDTFNIAASLTLPIEASPALAMQPHSEQSGRPPIGHGIIGAERSTEMRFVICANMHSDGAAGG